MQAVETHRKGGRTTPIQAGLGLAHRDAIWDLLKVLPEGSLFRPEVLLADMPSEAKVDFVRAVGHDHVHVSDGWHTAIKEGVHNRLLPNPTLVAKAWCDLRQWGEPVEFGDWTAWREGLYRWEPIAGFRFRVTAPNADSVLALGHMRIRIQSGPTWLMQPDMPHRLVQALVDMPRKTIKHDLRRWIHTAHSRRAQLLEALTIMEGLDEAWEASTLPFKGDRPSYVARIVREALE